MPGVADRDQARAVRDDLAPRLAGGRPGGVRVRRRADQGAVADLQDQVMLLAGPQRQRHGQGLAVGAGPGAGRAGQPEADRAAAAGPGAARPGQVPYRRAAERAPQVQADPQPGRALDGGDPPQQHDAAAVGGPGQGLVALGHARAHPPAVPDERARLVVPAPDMPRVGGRDRVAAVAAGQRGEHRRAVPARGAQPGDRPVRPDDRAALPVRDERVLPQRPRPPGFGHRAPLPSASPAGRAAPGPHPVKPPHLAAGAAPWTRRTRRTRLARVRPGRCRPRRTRRRCRRGSRRRARPGPGRTAR